MVTFPAAGSYPFKFTVTDKNPSSTRYTLALDYIEISPLAANLFSSLQHYNSTKITFMNQLISSRRFSVVLLALALALFAFSLTARAVTPAPDGGYPNQNTAEGDSSLFSVTTGFSDTAVGFEALFSNTSGAENTATGYRALNSNTTGTRNTATGDGALARNTTGGYDTATVSMRSSLTPLATTTPPTASSRSVRIQPVQTTSGWALMQASVLPPATTILRSETQV
jgi:hypothetical protein